MPGTGGLQSSREENHQPGDLAEARPGPWLLSFGMVQSTWEFPGPWEKSGGSPSILKGETGRRG